jgi:hypothetical protein
VNSERITNAELRKVWIPFYLRLAGIRAWNGFLTWFKVTLSTVLVSTTGLVDLNAIGWKGAMATLLGTILYQISDSWNKNQLPEPTPPNVPPGSS